jgi:putative ABC transport system permease protein
MDDMSETSGSLPERVSVALVAPRFLRVLEVAPMLGRNFTPREEHFGGPDAVLISYAFWQSHFHGDPDAVGQQLRAGSFSWSVVGVMPKSFAFPDRDVELWAPSPPDAPYAQDRNETWYHAIGRMKPGVTLAQAEADMVLVQKRLGQQFPDPDASLTVKSEPLKETVVGGVSDSLWLLYGSVSLLLLIACSNIAALLLARTADREHEISVRFSLGASRRAIVVQLLSEVLLLALLGSLLGLAIAAAAAHAFHLLANVLPRAQEISLNWRIVVYSLGCAVATALLCGLIPALRGTRRQLAHSLARTSRTHASTRNPLQWFLVGVQVMLAVTLLTGAGLLLRSLGQLDRVRPGFDPSHVLTFQITGSWGETANMGALLRRIDGTLDALRAMPGVENAATAGFLPGVPAEYQNQYNIDGEQDPNRKTLADTRIVSQGYFETMKIPLLAGRACRQGSPTSDLLVNRSFAAMYLGDSPAVGHILAQAANAASQIQGRIVGVVGNAREEGLNTLPGPTVYICLSAGNPFPYYLVRTHGAPMAMADAIRRRIHQLEPNRSVYGISTLQEHLSDVSFDNRLRTLLLTLFAASAVLLVCLGLYGTLNYLGRMRQREVGVRLALGAPRGQILRRFLAQGMRVTCFGCLAGLLLSVAADRLLKGMLYGVSTLDAKTDLAVLGVILLVAILSSLLPAWRAARIEPVQVLRQE